MLATVTVSSFVQDYLVYSFSLLEPQSLLDWSQHWHEHLTLGQLQLMQWLIAQKSPLQFQLFYLLVYMHMFICLCVYIPQRFSYFLEAQWCIKNYAFLTYLEFVCSVVRGPLRPSGPYTSKSVNLTFMDKNLICR